MGYVRHHAMVVTSWDAKRLEQAHQYAEHIGMQVTSIAESAIGGYSSFAVVPDGSKEGWEDSDAGDRRRDDLIAFLDARRYEDGSSAVDWVEVMYADDDGECRVTRHGDEDERRKPPGGPSANGATDATEGKP